MLVSEPSSGDGMSENALVMDGQQTVFKDESNSRDVY